MLRFFIEKIIEATIVFLFVYFISLKNRLNNNSVKNIIKLYCIYIVVFILVSYILAKLFNLI